MADTKLVICEKCWGTGHVHGGEENSTWSKTCEDCRGIGFVRVPMTNADRIRAMSDEELAVWVTSIQLGTINEMCKKFDVEIEMPTPTVENTADVCEWLKQPAE